VIAPGPNEISFGRIAGRVARGTRRVVVASEGRVVADETIGGARFDFTVELPSRDLHLRITAVDGRGRRASTVIGPVFGLPSAARPRGPPRSHADARLGDALRGLTRGFPGICGVYVQDLRRGGIASWNADAHFPAASTLKVAIAVEVLRVLHGKPPRGSRLDRVLRRMIVESDDKAANELLVWLGGSTSGGSGRINGMLHALGLTETDMYGGYIVQQGLGREPSFVGKRTTARDYARLFRYLHLAAEGKGRLAHRFRGGFVPAEARFLLYLLAHTSVSWLDRYLDVPVVQKAGWITRARHDGGVVYWRGGAFVAVVMTWDERRVGAASNLLAGRVARAAFLRFNRRSP